MIHSNSDARLTRDVANDWLTLAVDNILIEFPHMPWIIAESADDYVLHRQTHPIFFGSFDWHSCVEMYWVAVRLMRLFPDLPDQDRAVGVINDLLTPENVAREAAFCAARTGFERPYGWGWLMKLQHELDINSDQPWASILRPLSDQLADQLLAWLPKLTYAQRIGMHTNTAFALTLALPFADANAPHLGTVIRERAQVWFAQDTVYPFAYEPSGADFLSAGLCEAVLMQRVLSPAEFETWVETFLPTSDNAWLQPAVVSDPTDGQMAHLHGLNLSRAWALGELAAALPHRSEELLTMRNGHIDASISEVSGSHYMVEHWLAAYALLLLTEPAFGTLSHT